jgi:hypothetical protein
MVCKAVCDVRIKIKLLKGLLGSVVMPDIFEALFLKYIHNRMVRLVK